MDFRLESFQQANPRGFHWGRPTFVLLDIGKLSPAAITALMAVDGYCRNGQAKAMALVSDSMVGALSRSMRLTSVKLIRRGMNLADSAQFLFVEDDRLQAEVRSSATLALKTA